MALAVIAAGPCFASDHADPTWIANNRQEANLTGLFFFPVGERYVAILDTRPTLTAQPPYKLRPYRFTINIDTHSTVRFAPEPPAPAPGEPPAPPPRPSAEQQALSGDLARYGGTAWVFLLANIVLMPLLISIAGVSFGIYRRKKG